MSLSNSIAVRVERPQIHGVRAIACLLVLIGHSIILNLPSSFPAIGAIGRTGVWLFFVLSAFLLTSNILERGFTAKALIEYAVARVLRIVPLFLIALLFYYALHMLGLNNFQDLISAITLQTYAGHLWTIPPELKFYVALPFIVFGLQYAKQLGGLWISALCMFAALMICAVIWWPFGTPNDIIGLGAYLPTFCCGIAAAFATRFLPSPSARTTFWLATISVSLVVVTIVFVKLAQPTDPVAPLVGMHVWFGVLWAIFVYASYFSTTAMTAFLSQRWLVQIGEASYSVYLFHWAFAEWFRNLVFPFGAGLAVVCATFAGLLSYKIIEKRLFDLRRPVSRRILAMLSPSREPGSADRR